MIVSERSKRKYAPSLESKTVNWENVKKSKCFIEGFCEQAFQLTRGAEKTIDTLTDGIGCVFLQE